MKELLISGRVQILSWNELSEADRVLLAAAIKVRANASVPVSGFMVGAAILAHDNDRVFSGCNVEDIAQTSTIHAEASALSAVITRLGSKARCRSLAIALGHKSQRIRCPPAVTGKLIEYLDEISYTPCGHCRGLLSQYGDRDMRCICLQKNGQVVVGTMADFFPCGFTL